MGANDGAPSQAQTRERKGEGPRHGTRYGYLKLRCREECCRSVWNEYQRNYSRTPSGAAARRRAWENRDPERSRATRREYRRRMRQEDPEKAREMDRKKNQRRYKDPVRKEKAQAAKAKRRGIKRQLIFIREGGICYLCLDSVTDTDFHVDHIVPMALGGSNHPDNLACACAACNLLKADADWFVA